MSELGSEACRLLDLARASGGPTAEQKRQLRTALALSLAATATATATASAGPTVNAAGSATSASSASLAATGLATMTKLLLVAGLGVAVGVGLLALNELQPGPARGAAAAEATGGQGSEAAPRGRPASGVGASAPGAPTTPWSLADELRVLDVANTAVGAREWDRVARAAREYRDAFPGGALETEARALEVLGLCGQGHAAEARGLADALRRADGQNPAVQRLRASCASAVFEQAR